MLALLEPAGNRLAEFLWGGAELGGRPRLIAHRGAWDADGITENTMPAFERAAALGCEGIEFDVRLTADEVPVILHDPDLRRVAGARARIEDLTYFEARRIFPQLASFSRVITAWGGRLHLMIELKSHRRLARMVRIVQQHLGCLEPKRDYHLLILEPAQLEAIPARLWPAVVAVGTAGMASRSRLARRAGLAGIAGPLWFCSQNLIDAHRRSGQWVGTGFVTHRGVCHRELRRGAEFVFTNVPGQILEGQTLGKLQCGHC
ncbi:MAG: hypothetical protein D6761_02300 [Candidatus Dadabacteria bacterium]|nr:MAG: hypothetical protein D6761_02300 [Candidatus Dadabacteria bacterium]